MRVERYATGAAFMETVGEFLLAAEVENALMIGIARQAASQDGLGYFAAVFDDSRPLFAAFSTNPEKLGLSGAVVPDAVEPLMLDAMRACPRIRLIGGPEPLVANLANRWALVGGRKRALHMASRIYQLSAVVPPSRTPEGQMRAAVESDTPVLSAWVERFLSDAGEQGNPLEVIGDRLRNGQLFVWDNGGVVSMAGWSGKTPNGARVNLVYTPESQRGRGYASANVAALSQHLLDSGNRFCCLYTDLANPTSNAIYQAIGYRPVCDTAIYQVTD